MMRRIGKKNHRRLPQVRLKRSLPLSGNVGLFIVVFVLSNAVWNLHNHRTTPSSWAVKRVVKPWSSSSWASRLALRRATTVSSVLDEQIWAGLLDEAGGNLNKNLLRASSKISNNNYKSDKGNSKKFAAVFLQVGNWDLWDDMFCCTANVAAAMPPGRVLDVYVSRLLVEDNDNQEDFSDEDIQSSLKTLQNVDLVTVNRFENRGADIGQFLKQLEVVMTTTSRRYEVILKQHTKSDAVWRQRHLESLCGTPEHVQSIWRQFREDPNLGMVAPKGTAFGPSTPTEQIFPHIVTKYNWVSGNNAGLGPATAFDEEMLGMVHDIYDLIEEDTFLKVKLDRAHYRIVAGTAFWIRYDALQPDALVRILPRIYDKMVAGYQENLGIEHAMERFIPTSVLTRGMTISDIAPAPRVMAIYFPQYHAFPENDRFWGKNFTEWTLLRPLKMENIRKPLPLEEGGLGYYDLLDINVRKAQADLARNAGLTGFMFYHYWFSGSHAPRHHKVMYKVHEQMLKDGEPNMPFMMSWANEPWSRRWTGEEKDVLLSQEYGEEDEWEEHFLYLLQFFRHPNYIRKYGKPVFVIYRTGHVGTKLKPMMHLWRKLALDHGLPGLHLVTTVGNFVKSDEQTAAVNADAGMDAAFHFWPLLFAAGFFDPYALETASWHNVDPASIGVSHQYWGAFTGFDRRPRDNSFIPILRSVEEFQQGVYKSFWNMNQEHIETEQDLNLFFVTAWNEWNEQALLEPDDTYRFGFLRALKHNLQHFPLKTIA